MIEIYQKAINEIDDYFEYRYKSEADKNFVISVIDELTNKLQEETINKADAYQEYQSTTKQSD